MLLRDSCGWLRGLAASFSRLVLAVLKSQSLGRARLYPEFERSAACNSHDMIPCGVSVSVLLLNPPVIISNLCVVLYGLRSFRLGLQVRSAEQPCLDSTAGHGPSHVLYRVRRGSIPSTFRRILAIRPIAQRVRGRLTCLFRPLA